MLASLKIATRLKLTLGLLGAMLLGVAALALWQMGVMRASTHEITRNWLPSVEHINAMNTSAADFRIGEVSHVLTHSDVERAAIEKDIDGVKSVFNRHHDAYIPLISTQEERQLYESFASDWQLYLQMHERLIEASRKNETERARAMLDRESKPVFTRLSATLDKLVELNHDGSVAESAASDNAYTTARAEMGGAVALALLLALAAGFWLVRSVTGPLNQAVAVAERVAAGDLSGTIDTRSQDEAGQVLQALGRMQSSLAQVVADVRSNSDSVATASVQIAHGNHDLSQRTEEQASALQQTSATMEQLSTTVRANADSAKQADQLAQGASAIAVQGGEVVGRVVATMQDISESSRKIGEIIGVIDGIAFQTNILALNAAVEAARAGEQGRGFAVVAGEVRTLAQRSAEAAKEIKALIGRSVEQVAHGTVLVDQAGRTMGEIVGSIQQVSTMVAEISASSAEQSSGIAQVGEAVSQMDQVTQQNAALVEESAAAAASLQDQAAQLVQTVAVFKLSGPASAGLAPAENAPVLERRSPQRALNVSRPAFKSRPAPTAQPRQVALATAKTGTDDWAAF